MSEIKKILCPTDWSEPSRVALQGAVNIARHEEAELLLLHVLPPLGRVRGIASVRSFGDVVQNEALEKLTALIAECVPSDIRVTPIIRFGEEADEIYKVALQADVVVMSTHGRSGWTHWAFGLVAETVLRQSACPIYVVGPAIVMEQKNGEQGDGRGSCFDFPYKQVLWPTDWSEPAERALDVAIAIAAHHAAQLLLLHVIDSANSLRESWQHDEAEDNFRNLCERKPEAKNARHLICYGDAATEITRTALVEGVDLIVMNTHGRTGWQPVKLGSTTQKVLRQAPCPILLVPFNANLSLVAGTQTPLLS